MGSRTAEVQAVNRCAVLRPTGQGPHEEQLPHVDVAVKDIALGNTKGLFEIKRSVDFSGNNGGGHVRRIAPDFFEYFFTAPLIISTE